MDIKQRVIKTIRDNKISTTEVADVLGKTGHVKGPLPLVKGLHKVGEVDFVWAWNGSNWEVHEQVQTLTEGRICFVQPFQCADKAIFGDLVSKYILLYRRSEAIIVNGFVRDAHTLVKESYPVWCTGVTPIGCHNGKNDSLPPHEELDAMRKKYHGGIMVADESGVVLIEAHQINEELVKKLEFIELQEDVWFFCMDSHKMSTFEIVCQKKYLDESEGLITKEKLFELNSFTSKG